MAAAIGWVFIWATAAVIVLAAAFLLRLFCGVVGLGLRLLWLVFLLPAVIIAAVLTGPLLLVGIAALVLWAVAALCRR